MTNLEGKGVGRRSGVTEPLEKVVHRSQPSSTRLEGRQSGYLGNGSTIGAQSSSQSSSGDVDALCKESAIRNADHGDDSRDRKLERRKSRISASFSRLSRRSWISSSPSPSPGSTRLDGICIEDLDITLQRRSSRRIISMKPGQPNSSIPSDHTKEKQDTHSSRRIGRDNKRLSALITVETNDIKSSPLPPVPKLPSGTRSSSPSSSYASSERPPTLPKSMSFERLQSNGLEKSRKRDELWSAFRTLDSEFHK